MVGVFGPRAVFASRGAPLGYKRKPAMKSVDVAIEP